MIGLVILGVILLPLFFLMIAAMVGSPKSPRVSLMFTGTFLIQIIAIIVGFVVFATVMGFIVS